MARIFVSLLLGLLTASTGCARSIPRSRPYEPGVNPYPEQDSVTLLRQRCTGRERFHDPRCESYTISVLADGRTIWDGHDYVAVEGRREASISPEEAEALIERIDRRMQPLELRQCGIDHTHYVQVDRGVAGSERTSVVRGCGVRFRRLARPIDRAAKTRQWR